MSTVMTAKQFVSRCLDAVEQKSLYVMGCFGAPLTDGNKARYIKDYSYNNDNQRKDLINACDKNTFGWDCVCFIKGILWGWCGDKSAQYGGAKYQSNGVPDIGTEEMISQCSEVSTDFSNIVSGEIVHMEGHVGVYVGEGIVVEATPKFDDGLQITRLGNIPATLENDQFHERKWTRHGKLPWIDYSTSYPKKYNFEISIDEPTKDLLDYFLTRTCKLRKGIDYSITEK